ncbi:LysR substrate-binding domain-containing protein [Streptomyces sp. NPDC021224]|uniref:LysR substrate-binding domain-containing protein n=1 Tax=unclassified Streptomyces TaxID=2593676 RepID=UPI0037A847C6
MAELRRLRYFLAVAEERSFTRAAARLLTAQPALSRQIRELEKEMGVRLLERTTQYVEPTEAGRMLMERGQALVDEADRLWREVRGFAAGAHGSLSFGYSAGTGYETAPALLERLAETNPGITVDATLLSTAELLAAVADGTLDAALLRCPPPTPQLVRTLVRLEPQGVLMHQGHPLAARSDLPVAALANEAILLHPREANPGHHDAITAIFQRAGISPEFLPRRLFDTAHTPVAQGKAVTVVGASTLPSLPTGLAWRPLSPAETIEICLLTRGNTPRPAVAHLLHATAAVARERGWLRV